MFSQASVILFTGGGGDPKAFNFVLKYLNILHFDSSGARIVTEKNSERSELQRDHQRDIQNLKKDHKREMDVSQVKTLSFLPILCCFFFA